MKRRYGPGRSRTLTPRRGERRFGHDGFTLLEVIVAMTLMAIILAEVSGTLWSGVRSSEKGQARSDELERFRTVTSLLRDQVSSLLPLTTVRDGATVLQFLGKEDRMEFVSPVSLWGRNGSVAVMYGTTQTDRGDLDFVSQETDGTGVVLGGKPKVLLSGLTSVEFRYLERQSRANTAAPEWLDAWEAPDVLPKAVSVSLTAGNSETVLVIPIGVGSAGS